MARNVILIMFLLFGISTPQQNYYQIDYEYAFETGRRNYINGNIYIAGFYYLAGSDAMLKYIKYKFDHKENTEFFFGGVAGLSTSVSEYS